MRNLNREEDKSIRIPGCVTFLLEFAQLFEKRCGKVLCSWI